MLLYIALNFDEGEKFLHEGNLNLQGKVLSIDRKNASIIYKKDNIHSSGIFWMLSVSVPFERISFQICIKDHCIRAAIDEDHITLEMMNGIFKVQDN